MMHSCRVLAALVFSAYAIPLQAAAASAVVTPVPFPGGVAHPTGNTGYTVDKDDKLIAINLDTGKTLWTDPAAGQPLLAFQNRLAVLRYAEDKPNRIRVEFLDATAREKSVPQSESIELPAWASPRGGPLHFSATAVLESNVLRLKWEAHAFYEAKGGAAITHPELSSTMLPGPLPLRCRQEK